MKLSPFCNIEKFSCFRKFLLWIFSNYIHYFYLICLWFITMLLYMHKYIVSHICILYIWLLGYYTRSGMTVSENRARSKCFLNNFNMKANRNRCLLNICYVTGTVLTVWYFISTYKVPARGVPLEGDAGKKALDCTCCIPQQSVWLSCPLSKVEILLPVAGTSFPCLPALPLCNISVRTLLNSQILYLLFLNLFLQPPLVFTMLISQLQVILCLWVSYLCSMFYSQFF